MQSLLERSSSRQQYLQSIVCDHCLAVPEEINPNEIEGRRDLRDELTITIDGADAKDLDDAISIKKLSNGHTQLTVSIGYTLVARL